jgi:ubiquinone/menaquinone biosynthesis C-methylase UbiE
MVLCEHALFLFEEPDVVVKELSRVLKKKAPLIISAQNRYVQSLSSIAEKPNEDNISRAMKLLISEEREGMTKDGKVKVYTWTPRELQAILERNGLNVEKIIGKLATMPLRIKPDMYLKKKYSEDLFNKILQFELALCEKPDALALAGHLQAIAFKR